MADCSVDELLTALSRADQYPYNLLVCREFEHTVRTVSDQLHKRSAKLFCPELDDRGTSKAALVFWELYGETEGMSCRANAILVATLTMIKDFYVEKYAMHRLWRCT